MIDDGTSEHEFLSARVNALEAARKALDEGTAEAAESIRRIARSLREVKGLTDAASGVEKAPPGEVRARAGGLLKALRSRVTTAPANILVVDDDLASVRIITKTLARPGRNVLVASSAAEAEEILTRHEIRLLVMDLVLPDGDGRDVLARLRERPATASLPVIIASVKSGTLVRSECLALGAADYFSKPVEPSRLAITADALLQREMSIRRQTRYDALTGILNRAAFVEGFERSQSGPEEPIALAIIDVDHFKSVNDTYGHVTGDAVLRRLASTLQRSFRRADLLARWGGEEFVVLLPGTDLEGAAHVLEAALEAVRSERFESTDGRIFQVTFSAGVVEVPPRAALDETLLVADRLLYLAKQSGRNRVIWSTEDAAPRMRALVAEDDEVTAAVIVESLAGAGFEVVHCTDGVKALEMGTKENFSLAILDVNLPGMEGFEVLKGFRQVRALNWTPVVLLTARGKEEDVVRGFELGADDYVVKPLRPAEFIARVLRLIRRR